MGKKFTTFMVLLAAVLFTLPIQAQTLQKKGAHNRVLKTKVVSKEQLKASKAAYMKANDKTVGKAFRGNAAAVAIEEATEQRDSKVEALKAAKENELVSSWDWKSHQAPKYFFKSVAGVMGKPNFLAKGLFIPEMQKKAKGTKPALKAGRLTTQGDPEAIITEIPSTADVKYYKRSGKSLIYYQNYGIYYVDDQSGTTQIAFDGNDVYIKNPVADYACETWMKGTKNGNTITFPLGQFLYYSADDGYGLYLTMADITLQDMGDDFFIVNTSANDETSTEITYTINETDNTITQNGTSDSRILAVAWSDDNTVLSYAAPGGEYSTVFTLDDSYVPPSTDLVELPVGAEVQTWYAEGAGSKVPPTDPKVAFVGNDVYISNIFSDFPESWIKGTIDGTTVTFEGLQYLGKFQNYDTWAVSADENGVLKENFTFTYDETAKTLKLNDPYLVANVSPDAMNYLAYLAELTLYAEKPAPKQIDVIPYANDFSTEELQKEFSIIDANGDGNTWAYVVGGYYRIHWAGPNDDWFVSPAIRLFAGKKYHFAIDSWVQGASYPETFEVRAAKELTAEALAAGVEVLPSQAISNTVFKTFETYEFTVAEDGYYHIGIHNTSNDKYYQYVDNFLLEGVPATVPYSTDFTTEDSMNDYLVLDANEDGKTWGWSSSLGAYCNYNSSLAADDYLILPVKLEAGKNYDVTVSAAAYSANYPEKIEVVWGSTPTKEALTNVIIPETPLTSATFADYEGIISPESDGTYYVAVHGISDKDMYYPVLNGLSIKVGAAATAPQAVSNFTAVQVDGELQTQLNFTAPTLNVAGNELTENMTIEVLRNGEVVYTANDVAPGEPVAYTDNVPGIGKYSYQVIPYNASGIGKKSEIIDVLVKAAQNVPYLINGKNEGVLDLFSVIDANEDGKTWMWNENEGIYCTYNSQKDANDYLITLPINMKAGKKYIVTVNAEASGYPERFEVLAGNAPTVEALTTQVIAPTEIEGDDPADYAGEFTPAADGQYYVAIHAISDKDMYHLVVNSIAIEAEPDPTAPAAVQNLTATAGAEGALEATISFDVPTVAINGTELEGNIDCKIYRNDVLVKTISSSKGEQKSWTDTDVEDGKTYTYFVVPTNESGDGIKSEKVSVYVGMDEIGPVENIKVTGTTANTISLTWDDVKGLHDGYINRDNIRFAVVKMHLETYWIFQYLVIDEVLNETNATSATCELSTDEGDQDYPYFGVVALKGNEAAPAVGDEYPSGNDYAYWLIGAPYSLPFAESFVNGTLAYDTWEVTNEDGTAMGMLTSIASDEDGGAVVLTTLEEPGDVRLVSGKIDLGTVANPTLLFDAMGAGITTASVYGSKDDGAWEKLADVTINDKYSTQKVALKSTQGTRFNRYAIGANIVNPAIVVGTDPQTYEYIYEYNDLLVIDNIQIRDFFSDDLAVSILAPKSIKTGDTAPIRVTASNEGENPVNGYKITVKAGDEVLLDKTVNETLAPFAKTEYNISYKTSIFDESADITISAEVSYANDLNPDNDKAESMLSIKASTVPVPQNVTASLNDADKSVDVNWDAPSTEPSVITENFQSYENGANDTGLVGGWTLVNNNGATKGGVFQDLQLANDGLAKAWEVFKPSEYGVGNEYFAGPNGSLEEAYLISAYNADEATQSYVNNDDWLISPALPGVAQTIKFKVSAIDTQYGPSAIQVLASTTDNDVASFEVVSEVALETAGWGEVTATLPEGTKYFAIRNVTIGDYALIVAVGDIEYLSTTEVLAYNIYVDSKVVATVEGDKTTYNITEDKFTEGEHLFGVSAITTAGESRPIAVPLTIVTSIKQITDGNKTFDVYTLDGKLVRQQAKSLEGLKGIYVINGKAVMVK